MFDASREGLQLGVVGCGLMGRGIAQIAALAGLQVMLQDARPGAAAAARADLAGTLRQRVAKGRLAAGAAEAALARLQLADGLEALASCAVVVEAIVEDLAAKRAVFAALEAIVADDCILATNTSSLSVTEIAAACTRPGRVAGFHFFSPVPQMKLVEVVDGVLGASWVGDGLCSLARRFGHTPVRAKDSPGFIVNHAGRAYLTEALRVLSEGVAPVHTIDRCLKASAGFRLGPFELMDLVGLDVSLPVMEAIYTQYYQEPRYRPVALLRPRLAAGLLGRKSGQGFYDYSEGQGGAPHEAAVPPRRPVRVWLGAGDEAARASLAQLLRDADVAIDTGLRPGADSLCLVMPLGEDATSAALAQGLDATRTLGVDPLGLERHLSLMRTPLTRRDLSDALWGCLAAAGRQVSVMHDSAGFIVQRVLAMIVNIGCDIAQQRIATPEDIDRAVTLGLAYPAGPLALGDQLGPARVLRILEGLYGSYRDPRYRPSPWLTRRARLGVSLLTPEG